MQARSTTRTSDVADVVMDSRHDVSWRRGGRRRGRGLALGRRGKASLDDVVQLSGRNGQQFDQGAAYRDITPSDRWRIESVLGGVDLDQLVILGRNLVARVGEPNLACGCAGATQRSVPRKPVQPFARGALNAACSSSVAERVQTATPGIVLLNPELSQ
jgi:hypothetical protein